MRKATEEKYSLRTCEKACKEANQSQQAPALINKTRKAGETAIESGNSKEAQSKQGKKVQRKKGTAWRRQLWFLRHSASPQPREGCMHG
jgi:hypothetical protein